VLCLYLWLTSNQASIAEFIGRSQTLKNLIDSLLFLKFYAQALVISFTGLFNNVAEGMPDYASLSLAQP